MINWTEDDGWLSSAWPESLPAERADCGARFTDHATFPDWSNGMHVLRCATCCRTFPT